MDRAPSQSGFWPQVARPTLAWLFACALTGFLVGGYFTVNYTGSWVRLYEVDWFSILTDQRHEMMFWWSIASVIIVLLTPVPSFLFLLLVKWLWLPRGWSDVAIGAALPFLSAAGVLIIVGGFDYEFVWFLMIDLMPIGALGGFIYWLAAGCPVATQIR